MASINPQIYYEDESLHSSYKYETLVNLVNNFMDNYVGDGSLLGQIPRRKVIYWMKKGIQQFNYSNLQEVKGCELELNDTLTAIYPPNYVNWVRVSYVHPISGKLMPMSINRDLNVYPSYLQDQDANILFDQDGFILEGSTMNAELESQGRGVISYEIDPNCFCNETTNFSLDATENANGYFNVTSAGFHFSSDALSKVIMLEFISDGLEHASDSDIRINKLAEIALYNWCKWNLLSNSDNRQEYVVNRAKKEYDTAYKNATIKLMNVRFEDVMFLLNSRKNWLR